MKKLKVAEKMLNELLNAVTSVTLEWNYSSCGKNGRKKIQQDF